MPGLPLSSNSYLGGEGLDTLILAHRSAGNALCVSFHTYSCVGLLVPILSASLALRCTWPLGCLYSYVLPYTLYHHVSF